MAKTLIIAQVTAKLNDVLQRELANGALAAGIDHVPVQSYAPDRVTTGSEEQTQLTLFLYRVAPNLRYEGKTIIPKTFDLFYLLAAYGKDEFHCEMVLELAVRALAAQKGELDLNPVPVMSEDKPATTELEAASSKKSTRKGKQKSQPPTEPNPAQPPIPQSDPRKTFKLKPCFMSMEDMNKLWSSLQAKYRPSLVYQVSGVPID